MMTFPAATPPAEALAELRVERAVVGCWFLRDYRRPWMDEVHARYLDALIAALEDKVDEDHAQQAPHA